MINMAALEKCQELCKELLADFGLPLEHRILLNYYMAAQRDNNLCAFYLKCALSTVERLEEVEGTVDPMREILETQLKLVAESKSLGVAFDCRVDDFLSSYLEPLHPPPPPFFLCSSLPVSSSQRPQSDVKHIADPDRSNSSSYSCAA